MLPLQGLSSSYGSRGGGAELLRRALLNKKNIVPTTDAETMYIQENHRMDRRAESASGLHYRAIPEAGL